MIIEIDNGLAKSIIQFFERTESHSYTKSVPLDLSCGVVTNDPWWPTQPGDDLNKGLFDLVELVDAIKNGC